MDPDQKCYFSADPDLALGHTADHEPALYFFQFEPGSRRQIEKLLARYRTLTFHDFVLIFNLLFNNLSMEIIFLFQ